MRSRVSLTRLAAIGCVLLAICSLGWCIYRDIQIEKLYPGDLRNRIVASRLQMDGISPYFFHAKVGDPEWHYDPQNYYTRPYSNVTCTPYFHQLISPIAMLPQRTISRLWLALDYAALVLMVFLAWRQTTTRRQKWAIVVVGLSFLYMYAWTDYIYNGQMYLFIAFLGYLLYYVLTRPPKVINAVLAGALAVSLVLVRPPIVIYLLPLLLIAKNYPRKYIRTFIITTLAIVALAFSTQQSRHYWSDYRAAMKMHLSLHHGDPQPSIADERPPKTATLEGWDFNLVREHERNFAYRRNGENGNIMVFSKKLFHFNPPVLALTIGCILTLGVLLVIAIKRRGRWEKPSLFWLAVLGFALYMLAEFFSPIHRANYNTVQWIFPLLLLATRYSSSYNKIFVVGILTGMFLNTQLIHIMPMQCATGEYLICACVLGIVFTSKTNPNPIIES